MAEENEQRERRIHSLCGLGSDAVMLPPGILVKFSQGDILEFWNRKELVTDKSEDSKCFSTFRWGYLDEMRAILQTDYRFLEQSVNSNFYFSRTEMPIFEEDRKYESSKNLLKAAGL
jgi:hypothetical protein